LDFPVAFVSSIVIWGELSGDIAWVSLFEVQDFEFSWHRV